MDVILYTNQIITYRYLLRGQLLTKGEGNRTRDSYQLTCYYSELPFLQSKEAQRSYKIVRLLKETDLIPLLLHRTRLRKVPLVQPKIVRLNFCSIY